MSLEAAAKELEILEMRMKYRSSEDHRNATIDGVHGQEAEHAKNGNLGNDVSDRSHLKEGRKGFFFASSPVGGKGGTDAGKEDAEDGGEGEPKRQGSPARVHLTRTGSIEIERGGYAESFLSRSKGSRRDGTKGLLEALEGSLEGEKTTGGGSRTNQLDQAGATRDDDDQAYRHEEGRWAREARWRAAATMDSSDPGRSSLGAEGWASTLGASGSVGGVSGGCGIGDRSSRKGGGEGGSSRGWRTEADADLSDIKATMRRLDGAGVSNGVYASVSDNNFGFDLSASTAPATAAAAGDLAGSIRPAPASGRAFASHTHSTDGERHHRSTISRRVGGGGGAVNGKGRAFSASVGDSSDAARAMGWGTGDSSSKAVLSALRALQDKIRKLESERDRASVEASTLKRQIAALQTENDRAAQVNMAGVQEKALASRLAYERLQADKIAADVRLRKAEEQKRLLAKEANAAKEGSAVAEAARQTAESRVCTLEDRLLGLGRQEEKHNSAQAGAIEASAATAREKAEQINSLREKAERLKASATSERKAREECEDALARALSAKGKVERFLEGVLRVNEELVKASGGRRAGGAGAGGDAIKRKKKKRPKDAAAAAAAAAVGAGGVNTAGGRGSEARLSGIGRDGFNVGTHTAKRASARAKKVRQEKRAPTAPAVLAAWGSTATTTDLSNPPTVHRTREQASSTRPSRQRKASSKAARKTASGRRGARSTATAVAGTAATAASRKGVVPYAPPFLTPGEGTSSYNVVSAVSKAVRTARRGRPRESLDKLYAQVGDAVVDSINDVPFMFRGPRRSGQQQQRTRPLRRTGTGTVRGFQGTRRAGRGATAGGRAVLDVAMPGVRGLNLDALDSSYESHEDIKDRTSRSREDWTREWNRAIGLEEAPQSRYTGETGGEMEGREEKTETEEFFLKDRNPIKKSNGHVDFRRDREKDESGYHHEGGEEEGEGKGDVDEDSSESDGGSPDGDGHDREEDEDPEDEDQEEGDSLEDQDLVSVSGLPTADGCLSSGDERAWRRAGNYAC